MFIWINFNNLNKASTKIVSKILTWYTLEIKLQLFAIYIYMEEFKKTTFLDTHILLYYLPNVPVGPTPLKPQKYDPHPRHQILDGSCKQPEVCR